MHLGKWKISRPVLGKRILKTGIAIFMALLTAEILGVPSPAIAGAVAIFCIQQTTYRSYRTFLERTFANLSGAVIAVLFGLVFGSSAFITSLACLITLSVLVTVKKENHIPITLATIIIILESTSGAFVYDAIVRFGTIMIGVTVAFLINVFVLPPSHEGRLFDSIKELSNNVIEKSASIASYNEKSSGFIKDEKDYIYMKLVNIEKAYELYKDDRKFYKKKRSLHKARKLIIYRQMIITLKLSFETFKRYHMYRSDFSTTPKSFQKLILEQYETLGKHHDLIFHENPENISDNHIYEKINLTESARMIIQAKDDVQFEDDLIKMHMLSLIASIYNYAEAIDHLQNLLYSSSHFHHDLVEGSKY